MTNRGSYEIRAELRVVSIIRFRTDGGSAGLRPGFSGQRPIKADDEKMTGRGSAASRC